MKRTVLFLLAVFCAVVVSAQGTSCDSATLFCTGSTNNYPATTGVASPTYGTYPNYGCLCTMPNPAYYYMKVGSPGNIVIHISTSPAHDVDFICWGPFASLSDACTNGLTGNCTTCYTGCPNNINNPSFYPSGNITDCSYSANSTEDCYINNAVIGQYYMLLITNYSDLACNIIFSQTNTGQVGAGSTDCGTFPAPIVSSDPFCVGDTLKLTADTIADTVSGAVYNWSGPNAWTSTVKNPVRTNATTAMSGDYICIISVDTIILAVDTTVIVINPNPVVTVTSATICLGDSATLTASGANTYTWGNTMTTNPIMVSPPITSIYPVCGKDSNNCIAFANAQVTVNPNPIASISQSGNVLTSSSTSGNQWLLNGEPITGETNQTYTLPIDYTDTLCFSVKVTDANGCSAISSTICIIPVGIEENDYAKELYIYPNPFKDELTVETTSTKEQKLEILNLIGQTIYTSVITKKAVVKTGAFASGVYFIKLSTDKETIVKKFVKE